MATYTVMTGEGGELGAGLTLDAARKAAQEWADERGEAVYVAGPGLHTEGVERGSDEDIGERVGPGAAAQTVATRAKTDVVALMRRAITECRRASAEQAKGSGITPGSDLTGADCDYVVEQVEEAAGRKPTRAEWTEACGSIGYVGSAHYEG